MLCNTKGLVLRTIKYGETSLICTIFTELFGVQSYIIQGIRSNKIKQNKAGMLQPTTLLELFVYHKPNQNLQRIKEFQPAYIYTGIHQDVVKNCVAIFSVEMLLRTLPEHAAMPDLFSFSYDYFVALDKKSTDVVANFPVYFIMQCSRILGYEIKGTYSENTPHLNLHDGAFTEYAPVLKPFVSEEDARILSSLLNTQGLDTIHKIEMNAATRYKLIEWYIEFLQQHTQHTGSIKSLGILRAVLH